MNAEALSGYLPVTNAWDIRRGMNKPPDLEGLVASYYSRIRRAVGLMAGDVPDLLPATIAGLSERPGR